jgi:hypothetical protein
MTTPPETVKRILGVSLEHPGWGCVKLSSMLKLEDINVSSPTIQNILIKHNMGSKYAGLLKKGAFPTHREDPFPFPCRHPSKTTKDLFIAM